MALRVQDVTANSNHASVQNLRGWSIRGTGFVINLRAKTATGAILATLAADSNVLYDEPLPAVEGTYVEVVSGTLSAGVLYH